MGDEFKEKSGPQVLKSLVSYEQKVEGNRRNRFTEHVEISVEVNRSSGYLSAWSQSGCVGRQVQVTLCGAGISKTWTSQSLPLAYLYGPPVCSACMTF